MREATDTGRQTKPRFLSKILGDASQLGLIVRSPVALANTPTAAGARRGEVAGLTWDDVDLDGHELHIDWTLGHVGHDMRWKPRPKSEASKRTIALDTATVDALRTPA